MKEKEIDKNLHDNYIQRDRVISEDLIEKEPEIIEKEPIQRDRVDLIDVDRELASRAIPETNKIDLTSIPNHVEHEIDKNLHDNYIQRDRVIIEDLVEKEPEIIEKEPIQRDRVDEIDGDRELVSNPINGRK